MKYKSFSYWLVVFGVTWGQIILISSAIREPTAHNLTLMLAIQTSGLYTLILYLLRGYWMPWLIKRPLSNAVWLGIFNAASIETLFWGIQKMLGATDVAAHPNLLVDLALTMPWYAGLGARRGDHRKTPAGQRWNGLARLAGSVHAAGMAGALHNLCHNYDVDYGRELE